MQTMISTTRFFITAMLLMAVFGCAPAPKSNQPTTIIPAFHESNAPAAINQIRLTALRETATALGAQGGLAWRSQQINTLLLADSQKLNQIFNFRGLILKQNVLPPVLVEGKNELNVDNPDTLRLADKIYKIESPPRFVTAPPIWRDYLWMNFKKPAKPDPSLLPKTAEERVIWNQYIASGWQDGIQQANQIFSANLGRMKRDFQGMILYRILLAQNMVTPPYVAKANLGVTGDDKEMRINDQVLRITATSKLVPNSKVWKPALTPGVPSAEQTQ